MLAKADQTPTIETGPVIVLAGACENFACEFHGVKKGIGVHVRGPTNTYRSQTARVDSQKGGPSGSRSRSSDACSLRASRLSVR